MIPGYIQVRRGRQLLFEYDPGRELIRIKVKGDPDCHVIDLREFRRQQQAQRPAASELHAKEV